ncbi:hypothetical protein BC939DRAFT_450581 [Gamsiella multidivaricata]|uniref:uncharacterized protein n=1 Tax=Gamsiella multidivaricata TaxID=101098 RepID=UPI00221EEF63|nr:uncharacterized protein BC939DRAFT_450581 [Gamsiella multidivaricata]KAI7824106.1 hypothetical protein BC939DRAFT_450581 [Gamsiella multidivaricata]
MSKATPEPLTVLIVGAGLGGLVLALLLEKINIPYRIFERASTIKPLGSVLAFNANILSLVEQLGILDEVMNISKIHEEIKLFDVDKVNLGTIAVKGYKEITGYDGIVFSRPDLYTILLSKVPADKILFGKRVLRTETTMDDVVIHCSDSSAYRGHIVVGADGAYSSVRQNLYQELEKEHKLPKSDTEKMAIGYLCVVGVTSPMPTDRYPELEHNATHFIQTVDNDSSAWSVTTIPGNRIGWALSLQFTSSTQAEDQHFRNSKWESESSETILKRYYDSPSNLGGTMGDIFDATPKEGISTVYLEEKLFETWCHGRTVLIGDACHKMLPHGGQGAMNAMQDAAVLANCIYDMGVPTQENIEAAFQSYRGQRYPRAKADVAASKFMSRLMSGQQWLDRLVRWLVFQHLPTWVSTRSFTKAASYRPQAVFLPLIENRGTGPVLPQTPSKRAAQEQKANVHGQHTEAI